MDFYQILALFAGFLVVISTLPQVVKTLKTKDVKSLSLEMFFILMAAQAVWFIYGVHIKDIPIIVTNCASLAVVLLNIILILKYRNA